MNNCNSAYGTVSGFDAHMSVRTYNNMKYFYSSTNTVTARTGNSKVILDKFQVHANYTSATICLQNQKQSKKLIIRGVIDK